jgi:hypothetical protein
MSLHVDPSITERPPFPHPLIFETWDPAPYPTFEVGITSAPSEVEPFTEYSRPSEELTRSIHDDALASFRSARGAATCIVLKRLTRYSRRCVSFMEARV